uniref:Uncharacterized protein n=1 Tax=Grammatophora oceanica TaxID=210454 RepID=A0A7S1VD97_9STRA
MLREFLLQQIILGDSSVGHADVDGLFLDDYWCSDLICELTANTTAGCPCDDPVQGPTEVDAFNQVDMGLTDLDIMAMTMEWNKTMTAIHQALLKRNAYTWSLMYNQENANAEPHLLTRDSCAVDLRDACRKDSIWQRHAMLFGFTATEHDWTSEHQPLAQLSQDLAFFLLVRGPYAWAGWGAWGMTWPFNAEPAHGGLPPLPHGVPLPRELHVDYGEPLELCKETAGEPGVFRRTWSRASIELDCNSFKATIDHTMIHEDGHVVENELETSMA